ncbi:ExbD/TolR family protein [Thiohalospira sp.]|uniref:ExbD/TolR family protein n=1 Tax=Thiohalospira sp. TaxID=3080549 RepID=UPI00397FA47D
MNLRPQRRREEPDINLTPLIDVVFLLLIFFMVSTSFQRDTQIPLRLPEAESETMETDATVVEVGIDGEGRYFVNRDALVNDQRSTIRRAIEKAAGEADSPQIIISADRSTSHEAVVRAMDAARHAGYNRITLATRRPAGEGDQ